MCGTFSNPHEIARALTVAAAEKVIVNQAGKSVEESNIELGKQMALLYKTILNELTGEDDPDMEEIQGHTHSHDGYAHSHSHSSRS
jgi:hypothetical protein